MRRRERRDDRGEGDRRDNQPDQEQNRGWGEQEIQEGDTLSALKAILAKVAPLLKPLQLTPEESSRLVEHLYGSVLDMDVKLAGESDDTRKSSVLSHIQNADIRREGGKIVVDFPQAATPAEAAPKPAPKASKPKPKPQAAPAAPANEAEAAPASQP
jgi:hypothetical protein